MSVFKSLLFVVFCSLLSASAFGQECYDNSLNSSGIRAEHDSLNPIACQIDELMPDAVTSNFKVYSVVNYSLDQYKAIEDQDVARLRAANDFSGAHPYHLVLWWKQSGNNFFDDLEILFSFPDDANFGNCFTGAKIALIKAQVQQYADSLISVTPLSSNNYISIEVNALKKARGLIQQLSDCCASKNKSSNCSLCIPQEDLALMKYNEGLRELITTDPLDASIDYDAESYTLIDNFRDYVGKALIFETSSIQLQDEYQLYTNNNTVNTSHEVYFVNDSYFCNGNTIPTDSPGGYTFISVTKTGETYKLEIKHNKVGDTNTFAEFLIKEKPEELGYLIEATPLKSEDLFPILDYELADAFITGSGAFIKKKNGDSPDSYRLNEVKLARPSNYPVTRGSLYSFEFNSIEYKSLKEKDTDRYLGYYDAETVDIARFDNKLLTTKIIKKVSNEFTETENWCIVPLEEKVTVVSLVEDCNQVLKAFWKQKPNYNSVIGLEREIIIPPNAEDISYAYTSFSIDAICCGLGQDYVSTRYAEVSDVDEEKALFEIGAYMCEIGETFFETYESETIWDGKPNIHNMFIDIIFERDNLSILEARDRVLQFRNDVRESSDCIDLDSYTHVIDRAINEFSPAERKLLTIDERISYLKALADGLDFYLGDCPGDTWVTEGAFMLLLNSINEIDLCPFAAKFFSDEELLLKCFSGFSDPEFLWVGDHRQKQLIERLFQIYTTCHGAFIENGNGEIIDKKIVLEGNITFGNEDIEADCFTKYYITKTYGSIVASNDGGNGYIPVFKKVPTEIEFNGPLDYVLVDVRIDDYAGITNMDKGVYPIPSFIFCIMSNHLDDEEMTAFINNAVFTILVGITLGEAAVATGVARGLLVLDAVAATSFRAAHEIIYSSAFEESFEGNTADYEAFKTSYATIEKYGNWVIAGTALATAMAGPLRNGLRANKGSNYDNIYRDISPGGEIHRIADELGEEILQDHLNVYSFAKGITDNAQRSSLVKTLRELRTADPNIDVLATLDADLLRNPSLMDGSVGRVRAWEVAFNGNVDAALRRNPDNLSFISRYLDDSQFPSSRVFQDISTAGGYNNWYLNVTQPARKVANYSPTLTGKLYDFVNPDGSLFGRLFKQSQSGRLEYTFKWTKPDGNVIDINGNSGEIYQGFIEFEIYLPSDLQGKGIGKAIFDDGVDYYQATGSQFGGIRGRWEGAQNPNGASSNLTDFWNAVDSGDDYVTAATKTWTGRRSSSRGFASPSLPQTPTRELVIVEFVE